MAKIAASVLNADTTKWKEWLPELQKARVDRIQFDIMDKKFVPNVGIDKELILEMQPHTNIFFESHLMVEKPQNYIKEFAEIGNRLLIFHVETTKEPLKLIKQIKDFGIEAGIALNNKTSPKKILPLLDKVDLALVMSVEAGFGGQKFDEKSLGKIKILRKKIDNQGLGCLIEVDGGINSKTASKSVAAGADVLVAGTFIFSHPKGIFEAVEELRKAAKPLTQRL